MNVYHALIIDDDANYRTILAQMLTLQRVTYSEVRHPAQLAETLAGLEHVDVVFLDLEMPDQNGFDVLKVLQANAKFQNVPVVACTAYVAEMDRVREAGFHSFLGKPVNAALFPTQLQRILKGERVWSMP